MGITLHRCHRCGRGYPDALLSRERLPVIEEMDEFGVQDVGMIVTRRRCANCLREAIYAGELTQNNRKGTEIGMEPALIAALLVRGYNEGRREGVASQAEMVAG